MVKFSSYLNRRVFVMLQKADDKCTLKFGAEIEEPIVTDRSVRKRYSYVLLRRTLFVLLAGYLNNGLMIRQTSLIIFPFIDSNQQAHDVSTTSAQRRCNVMRLHRR